MDACIFFYNVSVIWVATYEKVNSFVLFCGWQSDMWWAVLCTHHNNKVLTGTLASGRAFHFVLLQFIIQLYFLVCTRIDRRKNFSHWVWVFQLELNMLPFFYWRNYEGRLLSGGAGHFCKIRFFYGLHHEFLLPCSPSLLNELCCCPPTPSCCFSQLIVYICVLHSIIMFVFSFLYIYLSITLNIVFKAKRC